MEFRLEGGFLYAIDNHIIKLHKEPTMQDFLLYAIWQEQRLLREELAKGLLNIGREIVIEHQRSRKIKL